MGLFTSRASRENTESANLHDLFQAQIREYQRRPLQTNEHVENQQRTSHQGLQHEYVYNGNSHRSATSEQRWRSESFVEEGLVSTPSVVKYVSNYTSVAGWVPMSDHESFRSVRLASDSHEYLKIESLFKSTNKWFFKVTGIERIQNPYLYGAYLLKKEELERTYQNSQEKLLFHGTKRQNVDNICTHNFNWRLHGRGTGIRYGKGVSFTPLSHYATHYCDKGFGDTNTKVMLLAKVLVSSVCNGNAEMITPPSGYDTTQKENGQVIVKYDDNEFYPAYKLLFVQTKRV